MDAPLLAIVGPSGSGKSSLFRAGVLPALGTRYMVLRPGELPAADIAAALERVRPGERLVLAVDQFEELFAGSVDEAE